MVCNDDATGSEVKSVNAQLLCSTLQTSLQTYWGGDTKVCYIQTKIMSVFVNEADG